MKVNPVSWSDTVLMDDILRLVVLSDNFLYDNVLVLT